MTSLGETQYCLESDFIISLLKGEDSAVHFYKEIENAPLAITAIASVVLFEILRGKEQRPEKITQFEELRKRMTVLPFGEREAVEAGAIEKVMHERGQSISPIDLLIGATAKTNGSVLVTNDGVYRDIDGLQVQNY